MRNAAVKLLVATGAVAAMVLGGNALAGAEPQAVAATCNAAQMQNSPFSNIYQSSQVPCEAPTYNYSNPSPNPTW